MKKILFILMFILYGCSHDTCLCTETTTNAVDNWVDVNEYIIECDSPYTILETYWWGNVVTDCK